MAAQSARPRRKTLPLTAPRTYLWYAPATFVPYRIHEDAAFLDLTPAGRRVYLAMCHHSSLTRKSKPRRYLTATAGMLAEWAYCCSKTVDRAMPAILGSRLALRWHKGSSFTGASRFEIPASLAQVVSWRITLSRKSQVARTA